MADDLFSDAEPEVTIVPFEELVGEGKKYHDKEAVAKAVAEKDRFIQRLLDEKKELSEAFQKRMNEEEFLQKLQEATSRPPSPAERDTPAPTGNEQATLTPEDVEKLLEKREQSKTRSQNLDTVINKLKEAYGGDYKRIIAQKADSLGVGTEFLTDVAAKTPSAFYRLVGLDNPTAGTTPDIAPPRSSFSAPPSPNTGAKNFAYFQKLRREKGEAWYYSPNVQAEVWRELNNQGEANFYK